MYIRVVANTNAKNLKSKHLLEVCAIISCKVCTKASNAHKLSRRGRPARRRKIFTWSALFHFGWRAEVGQLLCSLLCSQLRLEYCKTRGCEGLEWGGEEFGTWIQMLQEMLQQFFTVRFPRFISILSLSRSMHLMPYMILHALSRLTWFCWKGVALQFGIARVESTSNRWPLQDLDAPRLNLSDRALCQSIGTDANGQMVCLVFHPGSLLSIPGCLQCLPLQAQNVTL